MTRMARGILALGVLAAVAGCQMGFRRTLENPGRNETLHVASGDRLVFELDENMTTGYSWTGTSDDGDVEVRIDHLGAADLSRAGAPGRAAVEVRVHRGFDGPATVRFAYRRPWEKDPVRAFTLVLYKRNGDFAVWE